MMIGYINFGQCRGCGRRVVWVRTKAGRNMPCDPELLTYRASKGGKEKIVTQDGEVLSADVTAAGADGATGTGYISHFATCPCAGQHRRGRGK